MKKRATFTLDESTEAKIKQYAELKLKSYPIRSKSKSVRDLIAIGMEVVLHELSTDEKL